MTEYRVCFLDGDGKISTSTELYFASDEEAIGNVEVLRSEDVMELWKGTELVKRFDSILKEQT